MPCDSRIDRNEFFTLTKNFLLKRKLHILRLDAYTRTALLLAGAFGAYSLGANNIANVMGVFVPCLLYTSPSPRDVEESRMPSSA